MSASKERSRTAKKDQSSWAGRILNSMDPCLACGLLSIVMWAPIDSAVLCMVNFNPHDLSLLGWSHWSHSWPVQIDISYFWPLCLSQVSKELRFHLHSFMHCPLRDYMRRSWPCHTFPDLLGVLWSLCGSFCDPVIVELNTYKIKVFH